MLSVKNPHDQIKVFEHVLFLVVLITLFEGAAQYNIKAGNGNHNYMGLFYGIALYGVVCYLLWRSYNFSGMGHVNLIWSCLSIVMAFILGIIFFQEKFNRYTGAAVLLAFAAIYVLHLSDEQPL